MSIAFLIVQPKERHGKAFQKIAPAKGKLEFCFRHGAVSTTFMAGSSLSAKENRSR